MPVNVSSSSPVVDVVVGLGAILLLLSIFTMQIQEWISQQYNLRARFLEQSIRGMLKDSQLVDEFYNHPFIQVLCFIDSKGRVIKPAYIPSRMSAIAIFDILINIDKSGPGKQVEAITLAKIRSKIQATKQKNPALAQLLDHIFSGLYQKTTSVEDRIYEARTNLETWFNNAMDHLSNWYRGYAQKSVFLIALVLALMLNADSLAIGTFLWREPSVRQVVLQNSSSFELPQEQFATNPERAMQALRNQFVGIYFPIGWVINEGPVAAFADAHCQLFPVANQTFGIPILGSNKCAAPPGSNNQTNIFLKLIGITISALVVGLGAPFCFDVWKRISSLRATGANPVEKEET